MARTTGSKDIPKRKRALILAEKNTQQYNRSEIAHRHGISTSTIDKISNDTVPEELRQMAARYESDFLTIAQANAVKSGLHTFNKIGELSADKAASVMEKNFGVAQVLQNRPTAINANHQDTPEYWIRAIPVWIKEIKSKQTPPDYEPPTREEIEMFYNRGCQLDYIKEPIRDEVGRRLLGTGAGE